MQPDLLKQLRDVHLPAPISWWPLAPGWYILFVIFIGLCIFAYFLLRGWQRRKRRRQTILQQFQALVERNDMAAIMALIKQVAINVYTKETVAQLNGQQWIEFLQQHNRKCQLTSEEKMQLVNLAYLPKAVIAPRICQFLQTWLEQQL
jgi:biopolymer transport protein ExbB/TolQ